MARIFEYLRWRLSAKKRAKESAIRKAQKYAAIKSSNQQGFDICLLGDSLVEYWKIQTIVAKTCFNAGVGDATTDDVLQNLNIGLLSATFDTFVIILGTNDVKYKYPTENTVNNLRQILDFLNEHYPSSEIIYLTIAPVNSRWDRKNHELEARNKAIQNVFPKDVSALSLDFLKDEKGNLKNEYTVDGLHFSAEAYKLIEEHLKDRLQ